MLDFIVPAPALVASPLASHISGFGTLAGQRYAVQACDATGAKPELPVPATKLSLLTCRGYKKRKGPDLTINGLSRFIQPSTSE